MGAAKYRKPAFASKAAARKLDKSPIVGSPKVSTSAKQPRKARKTKKVRSVGDIAPGVLLTSAKIEHTEPLRIEPLDYPLPVESLSQASLYADTIPGDLGGGPITAVAP
jgi:hypothetical protein